MQTGDILYSKDKDKAFEVLDGTSVDDAAKIFQVRLKRRKDLDVVPPA
jgi:hypothetical protein